MNTFDIEYEFNGENKLVTVKRIKRTNLTSTIDIYEKLLKEYVICNGAVGTLISKDKNWNLLKKLSELIPVNLNEKLNIEEFEDNYDLIDELFFSTRKETDTDNNKNYSGLIPKLNCLDFIEMIQRQLQEIRKVEK